MKKLLIILFTIAFGQAYGQHEKKYTRKAERATGRVEYAKALEYYNKALELNENSYEANAGKGMLLGEFMQMYEAAIPHLEKALSRSKSDTLLTIYNTLGKCYHFMGNYSRALYCYNKLRNYEEIGEPMFQYFLNKNIADCQYALAHTSAAPNYSQTIKNAGTVINTREAEYAPILVNKNQFIYTAKKKDDKKEKINEWDGKYFESMYVSTFQNGTFSAPQRYTIPDLGNNSSFTKFNESSVSISIDGRSLFLYKRGDIYMISTNETGQKPKKLDKQINLANYQNHASISKDNNTIYFSSETKDGYGGTDIFKSVKNEKGEWSEAQLLDSTINTMFNEDAPFISEEGVLYFSSNGHPGYGDYDIYRSYMKDGKWSRAENMGQPINSPGPDIFLSMVNSKDGFYSSYRPGGSGDLDIYMINFDPQLKQDTVTDPLLAKEKPKPVEEEAPVASTEKYLTDKELQAFGWNSSNLYFNYNEDGLKDEALATLDHNIEILKSNKKLMIHILGYSDARGQERYNTQLSLNRAQKVKQYLLKKGISRDRIKSVEGLGESVLLNNCGDGVECDETQHQLNRRVEVKVLNENYKSKNTVISGTD